MGADRALRQVSGGSAKFWEVSQDGTELTIRYGRLGTDGQEQLKSYASAEDAAAAAGKLVAEKLKKGYTEDEPEAAAPVAGGSAEDEDRLVMPAGWLRALYPRRGGAKVAAWRPDADASKELATLVDQRRQMISGSLEKVRDPELAAAGAAYLAATPTATQPSTPSAVAATTAAASAATTAARTATPLGAAVIAATVSSSLNWNERSSVALFAESWLAEGGLVFAATAMTELASLAFEMDHYDRPVRRLADGETASHWYGVSWMGFAPRIRAALVAASDAEYAEVVTALEESRAGGLHHRVAASFLAPTETGWVTADCEEVNRVNPVLASVLVSSITTTEQAVPLVDHVWGYSVLGSLAHAVTVIDGMGNAAVPVLAGWLDKAYDAESRRRLLGVLAELPTDEAMRALIDRIEEKYTQPALMRAAARFPRRAMRLLAASGGKKAVDFLLRAHVLGHPDLVAEVLASVEGAAAERIEKIVNAGTAAPAPLEALPEVLVSPPWTRPRKVRKPVVVNDLVCVDEPAVVWAPGERENWSSGRQGDDYWGRTWNLDWEEIAHQVRGTRPGRWHNEVALFVSGPEELAGSLIGKWSPADLWGAGDWMPRVVARFELAALPLVLDAARSNAGSIAPVLLPFAAPQVAVLMAEWLTRLKSVRATALAWLARHPETAARALIPAALGKAGPARRQAEQALAALVAGGNRDAVARAAATYGTAAESAVADLVAADPLDALPRKMPAAPEWTEVAILTPIHLRGDQGALPPEAVRHVMTMMMISKPGDPYAGLALVKEACDGRSLADFGWVLFQCWQAAGYPSKQSWVMDALGLIGDDETVRRLTPLIRTWPGDGGHSRAVAGLDLLASIGSEVALMHLHGIAEKVKFSGLKNRARQKMDEVAAELGLTPQELADRLVPEFGLSADGSLTLDYGRRQFVVGFDEQLKPYVTDGAGKRLKNLPKPGVNDDPELAPAAHRRFAGLKKDVRAVAADNIRRLEQAMVNRRRWSGEEFRRLFVGHPLLWHIVRRLVWGIYDPSGELTNALRVAEDRSFADVEDDTLALPDDAVIGVVHPLELGEQLVAWGEVFADYEILQPFPQLARETYGPDEALLAEIVAAKVPTVKVIGLERRGWRRGAPQDAGIQGWIERDVPGGRTFSIGLDPGIAIGYLDFAEEQSLIGVSTDGLDPITVSEILRDLREITR